MGKGDCSMVGSSPLSGVGLFGPEYVVVKATLEEATGTADATLAVQGAIDSALLAGIGRVLIPRGVYRVGQTIRVLLSDNERFELVGSHAVLQASGSAASPVLDITGGALSVRGLIIDCNDVAAVGLHARKLTNRYSVIQDVAVARSITDGFLFEACQGAVVRECVSRCNATNGWRILGDNASHFASCSASHNNGSGFLLSGLALPSASGVELFPGGSYITRATSECNGMHGILLSQPFNMLAWQAGQFVVRDGVVRGNRGHGVVVGERNTLVTGLWIASATGDAFPWSRGIVVEPATRDVLVFGNYLSATGGPLGYKDPDYDLDEPSVVLHSNFSFE